MVGRLMVVVKGRLFLVVIKLVRDHGLERDF